MHTNTDDTLRLQILAGIVKSNTPYIPEVVLTEEHERAFEGMWQTALLEGVGVSKKEIEKAIVDKYKQPDAAKEITDGFFDSVKKIAKLVWSGLAGAPKPVFVNINKLVFWIISKVLFKPMRALMMGIGGGAILLYQTLINTLNIGSEPTKFLGMNIPGMGLGIGDAVDDAFMSTLEGSWNAFIRFIQSYEPQSAAGVPLEVITETIAAGLKAIGLAVPPIIDASKMVGGWLLSIGLSNVAVIISWLYLIGGTVWLFEKAKPYIVEPLAEFVKGKLGIFKDEMEEPAKKLEEQNAIDSMRGLMEASAHLFDDRVEADTDRYYADMERREQDVEENLPYDIENAISDILASPRGQRDFMKYFMENLVENPQENDIELMLGIVYQYFINHSRRPLPDEFAYSETMNDVLAVYLRDRGYNMDSSEIEQYRSRTDESLFNSEVSYDTSGETDYFERYDELPDNINNLIDTYFSGDGGYEYSELENILKKFEEQGWTFDYGLDGSPYGLKPKD